MICSLLRVSRDSAVGIGTGEDFTSGVPFLEGARDFCLLRSIQPRSSMGTGGKAAGA
jgi:hypothetical protein